LTKEINFDLELMRNKCHSGLIGPKWNSHADLQYRPLKPDVTEIL